MAAVACGGSGNSTAKDQLFLQLTASGGLSAVDPATRVNIGHEMCSDLARYHGDATAAGAAFAKGDESTFTPQVVSALQAAATTAYCTKYR